MTEVTQRPKAVEITQRRRRLLPARWALVIEASIIVAFLAGSSAPTPLYATYQAEWHFAPITTTIVFGIYALAVLIALLVFGSLSDHVGRRPVLATTIAAQVVAMLIFIEANNVVTLAIARVIQGLSTGAAAGAIGAGMLDIDRVKGTITNAAAPISGTAIGSLVAGAFVQYLPWPTKLVYIGLIGVFLLQVIAIHFIKETSPKREGALQALKIEFSLPPKTRRAIAVAAPGLVATWSLAGYYGALGPSIIRHVTNSTSTVLAGLGLFIAAGTGAVAVVIARNVGARALSNYGSVALAIGILATDAGVAHQSATLFFGGTFIAGSGFGTAFQGAIRSVVPLALPGERAGVLSIVYVISYLAMGLPAVIAGWFITRTHNLLTTAQGFGFAVATLAVVAIVGSNLSARASNRTERYAQAEYRAS
jgi:MFS family permease